MADLRPVRWKEGMFLRPQHFQQSEALQEARLAAVLTAVAPFSWGVVESRVDESALANFQFQITRFEGVFPGGLLIDIPGNARLNARGFESAMTGLGRPLTVFLGIRARENNRPQTTTDGDSFQTPSRFVARERMAVDFETGQDPQPVEILEFDLQLLFEGESVEGFDIVPVARLVRTGNAARPIAFDPTFSPPALRLSASPVLMGAARSVVERLATVLRTLRDALGGTPDPSQVLLFTSLASALPPLREMVQAGASNPRDVYLELARLAGSLLIRDEQGRTADDIPPYSHMEPGPVFLRVGELIHQLSEPAFARRWVRVPMARTGDLFRAPLPAPAKAPGARLILEVNAAESTPKLNQLLLTAKTSAPSRIDTLSRHALPGIANELLTSPPPELPAGQKGSFFRLKTENSQEWTVHVSTGDDLAAFILGAPSDVNLNLLVILPQ